jgi:hypothetical protein
MGLGRQVRKYLASRSIEELALEYVTTMHSEVRPTKLYPPIELKHHLIRLIGEEKTDAVIAEAEKTYVLCGGDLKPDHKGVIIDLS